jgi:prepilin-type N-terminal cleavage/methylation domain-containing protein
VVGNRVKIGFTLIELLAVAALIGLLAGVTLLRYARMGSQTILINQSRQLYLAAKYARVAAIEQQKSIVLKLDETQRQIELDVVQPENVSSSQDDLSGGTTAAEMTALSPQVKNTYFRPIVLDSRLWIEQFVVGRDDDKTMECTFYPDGTAQACAIQLGDGQRHASVLITQTGRAKLQMNAAGEIQTGRVDLDKIE